MIIESINKFAIEKILEDDEKKDDKEFFQLRNEKELLSVKDKFVALIEKLRKKQYEYTLNVIDKLPEFKINKVEWDIIDRDQEISWFYNKDISEFLKFWWTKGAEYQNMLDSKVWLTTDIESTAVKNWADLHSAELISQIDETTRKRLNKLITNALDEWMSKLDLIKALQTDFWFSKYRANLIAKNELKMAYIQWQKIQFEQRQKESWLRWYKDWISHRDDRVDDDCLWNDMQWEVPFDDLFQSWADEPPEHPWCRCSISYKPYSNDELFSDYEDYAVHNEYFANMPEWYNENSSKFAPKEFMEQLDIPKYWTRQDWWWYFPWSHKIELLPNKERKSKSQWIAFEMHELWHAYYYQNIKWTMLDAYYKKMFKDAQDELIERLDDIKKYIVEDVSLKTATATQLFFDSKDLQKIKEYLILPISLHWDDITLLTYWISPKFYQDYEDFLDIIQSITSWNRWLWHSLKYIQQRWEMEFYAYINSVYFADNQILKEMLPETYKKMRNIYLWQESF